MTKAIIYPGNLTLQDISDENLYEINMPSFKNKLYIVFDPKNIKDYEKASEEEIKSFQKILQDPKFCGKHSDVGIKQITHNPPTCEININTTCFKGELKYELKIKGTSKEGRIGLYELTSLSDKGPTLLVASHYSAKGFHAANELNKKYTALLKGCGLFETNPPKTDFKQNRLLALKA